VVKCLTDNKFIFINSNEHEQDLYVSVSSTLREMRLMTEEAEINSGEVKDNGKGEEKAKEDEYEVMRTGD